MLQVATGNLRWIVATTKEPRHKIEPFVWLVAFSPRFWLNDVTLAKSRRDGVNLSVGCNLGTPGNRFQPQPCQHKMTDTSLTINVNTFRVKSENLEYNSGQSRVGVHKAVSSHRFYGT